MGIKTLYLASIIVSLSTIFDAAVASDCQGLPSDENVEKSLKALVANLIGDGSITVNVLSGPFYTCKVQGSTAGSYQEVSVIMTYNVDPSTEVKVGQFEMKCIENSGGGQWDSVSGSLSTPGVDYTTISLRTDCSECVSNSPPNENHCQPCHSDCNTGLMRCTGSGSSADCCVAFDNGVCSNDLTCTETNFVANEQNNYTCACNLTCSPGFELLPSCGCNLTNVCLAEEPCKNGGKCTLLSGPDNYKCDCTTSNFNGTNCTECNMKCESGYLDTKDCTCLDICKDQDPCQNGGVCVLLDVPDQYRCECENTSFTGTNCSVCDISCKRGYSPNKEICKCELIDICEAENPCQNGGTCVLHVIPEQYRCECQNEFGNTNCTDCLLQCNRGNASQDCNTCDCQTGYTGGDCTTCGRGYTARGEICELSNEGINFQWWWIGAPVAAVVTLVALVFIIVMLCIIVNRKKYGEAMFV